MKCLIYGIVKMTDDPTAPTPYITDAEEIHMRREQLDYISASGTTKVIARYGNRKTAVTAWENGYNRSVYTYANKMHCYETHILEVYKDESAVEPCEVYYSDFQIIRRVQKKRGRPRKFPAV